MRYCQDVSKLGCLRGGLPWVGATVAGVEGEEVALTSGVVVEEGNTAWVNSDWLGVSISMGIGVEDEGPAVLVPGVSPEDGSRVVTLSGVVVGSPLVFIYLGMTGRAAEIL